MYKYTQGFPRDTDKEQAKSEAVSNAIRTGAIPENTEWSIEILETEEHIANDEFCVVVRTG